jgi:hypothetical protein
LRHALSGYVVVTAYEKGWSNVSNGSLLRQAEAEFDAFITTDKNLEYQQNLTKRQIVLPTTNWPEIQSHQTEIAAAVSQMKPGTYRALNW